MVVLQEAEQASERERQLAQQLSLPLLPQAHLAGDSAVGFVLQYLPEGLSLSILEDNAPGPLAIDFNAPRLLRRSRDSIRKQGLGKALGLARQKKLNILDATAGTGTDAFLMAVAGCAVTMLEKSPIVHALLTDAIARSAFAQEPVAVAVKNMELHLADFLQFARDKVQCDVVYMDPMFPDGVGSARSQKPMYLLQQLLGKADREELMLAHALQLARRRVVIKRNRKSPLVPGPNPDIQFKGSSSRYDVYLVKSG